MSLVERVRRTIRRRDLLPSGSTVLAAVSGGADSVALVYLLLELQRSEGFRVTGLAHVHHGLRGADADEDEQFCRELALRLGLRWHGRRVDVAGAVKAQRRSLEDVARELRYDALNQCADEAGAAVIAVGHTVDDQAETVLLKLARGAGLRGLAGIRPRRGRIVRPLLDCRRADIREWLGERGVAFVEDLTNDDRRFARNRLRHDVLPALREACGPSVEAVLARVADVARVEDAFLGSLTEQVASEVLTRSDAAVRVDTAALARQPEALQRRVVLEALHRAGATHPGYEAVEAVLGLAADGAGLDLPGIRADRIGPAVVLTSRAAAPRPRAVQPFRYVLPVPGRVHVTESGHDVEAVLGHPADAASGLSVRVDAAAVAAGLVVRSWRPGDWLRPVGVGGRKKVQDVFVDRKVPRADRARLPLVADADDRVIWVPGHAFAEEYRATTATDNVVVLTMTESGGPE